MKLKRLSILILVALCAIALISCGSEEEVEITFNSDGGTAIKPIKAMTGDKISAPVAPKKDGYKLDGWYNGDEKWNFEKDKVKGEMTLTAKWTIETYTITYITEGGENSPSNKQTFTINDLPVILNDATHSEKAFVGWDLDGARVNKITRTGNKTVTATFAKDTDSLIYEETEGGYIVIGCEEETRDLCIPEAYNGKPVLGIKEGAFAGNDDILSVVLKNGFKEIGKEAFKGCKNLILVKLSKTTETIGNSAFFGCSSLVSFDVIDGVKYLGDKAFKDCVNLENLTLSDELKYVGEDFIYNCNKIKMEAYKGGYYIGNWLIEFFDDEEMRAPTFKEGIVGICSYAFYRSDKVRVLNLPNTIRFIGSQAFFGATFLTTVTFSENLEYIGMYAFYRCYKMKNVIIHEKLTTIGMKAFSDCRDLVINCVFEEKPEGFHETWVDKSTVNYGYKPE